MRKKKQFTLKWEMTILLFITVPVLLYGTLAQAPVQKISAWKIAFGGIEVKVPDSLAASVISVRLKHIIETVEPGETWLNCWVTAKFARMEKGLDSAAAEKRSKARGTPPDYSKEITILDKTQACYLTYSTDGFYKTAKKTPVNEAATPSVFAKDTTNTVSADDYIPGFYVDTVTIHGIICKKAVFHLDNLPDETFIVWYAPQIPIFYDGEDSYLRQLPGAMVCLCDYSKKTRTIKINIAKTLEQVFVDPQSFRLPDHYTLKNSPER